MKPTRHAIVRAQQRGIPQLAVDLLLEHGTTQPAAQGATLYFFDKKARRRLHAYAGPLSRILSEGLDVFAIVSDDGRVVTVGHRTRRIERDRPLGRGGRCAGEPRGDGTGVPWAKPPVVRIPAARPLQGNRQSG